MYCQLPQPQALYFLTIIGGRSSTGQIIFLTFLGACTSSTGEVKHIRY